MTATEHIYAACQKAGVGTAAYVSTDVYSFAFAALNRIYSDVWSSYPFRDEKLISVAVSVTAATQDLIFPHEVDELRAMRSLNSPIYPLNEIIISQFYPDTFANTGTVENIFPMPDSPVQVQPTTSGIKIKALSSSTADVGHVVKLWGTLYGEDKKTTEDLTLNGTSVVTSSGSFSELIDIFKPSTTGTITIKDYADAVLGYIRPWEDRGAYKRIRLFPIPSADVTLYLEAVRRFTPIVSANDSIKLKKCETGIFDMLVAELYEFNEQPDKASAERQKGSERLAIAINRETTTDMQDLRTFPVESIFEGAGQNSLVNTALTW